MKAILLTKGKVAWIDDDDFEDISRFKWCLHSRGYAVRKFREDGKQVTEYMHRRINGTGKGEHTDHVNGDPLDNRKENLRTCTRSENMRNRKISTGGTSKYKGVCWRKSEGKWVVQIRAGGDPMNKGLFNCEVEAAKCYDKHALELFGEFAKTNF